jgi:hypothetical protein
MPFNVLTKQLGAKPGVNSPLPPQSFAVPCNVTDIGTIATGKVTATAKLSIQRTDVKTKH